MKSRGSAFRALIVSILISGVASIAAKAALAATDIAPAWTNKLPAAIVGTPALSADSSTLYVGAANGRLYALSTTNRGQTNWVLRLPAVATSSPIIDDDGAIYIGCANGILYRITESEDDEGNLKGALDTLFRPFIGGRLPSPAIDDDGMIYASGTANHIYAVRPDSSKVWAYSGSNNIGAPIVGDEAVYVVSSGYVRGLDLSDGSQVSAFTPKASINSIPALGADGTLYFGANDDRVYALKPSGTTNDWSFNTRNDVMSSPAIGTDGSIYIASDNLRLYRLNTNGVQAVWTNRPSTRAPIRSPLSIGPQGTVYAGCDDRRLYAFSAANGSILWTVKAPAPIRSSAVIDSKGVVYFNSGRFVYAVTNDLIEDVGMPAWQMFRKDRKHTARATVNVVATNPPSITKQPVDQAANPGDSASFLVTASAPGTPTLFYQWYFNSNAIVPVANATATNAHLVLSNVTSNNAGFYHVVVTNKYGRATSQVARLTIFSNGLPVIGTQPVAQDVVANTTVRFSVSVVSGTLPFTYQWRHNLNPINSATNASATNSTLTLSNVMTAEQGFYDVVVSNSVGSVISAAAALTVTVTNTNAVAITLQPVSQFAGEGNIVTFSVTATGGPPVLYQWYFTSNAIPTSVTPTATNAALTISPVRGTNAGYYFVIVSGGINSVTSSVVTLTVTNSERVWFPGFGSSDGVVISNSAPFIIQNPTNKSVEYLHDVSFTVLADGARPLSYQWYFGTSAIDPTSNKTATNASLTLSNVVLQGTVRVVLSNNFGMLTSAVAFLSVTNIPGPDANDKPAIVASGGFRLRTATAGSGGLALEVIGPPGRGRVVLEYKNDLGDPDWKPLLTNDSRALKLRDLAPPSDGSRFYRVRQE